MIEEEEIDRVFRELRRKPFNPEDILAVMRGVCKKPSGYPGRDDHEMLVDAALKEALGWSIDEVRQRIKNNSRENITPAEILLMLRIRK